MLWLLVLLLVLFAVVGGIALTKFLFFVLIAALLIGLIGALARA
jgi:hypothetical protein